MGEEYVDVEINAINISDALSTEEIIFKNRDSGHQCDSSTTSNGLQQSNTKKENIGESSDNIVEQKMITEDNVANATIIIEQMK